MSTSPKPSEDYLRRKKRQMIELIPARPGRLSLRRRSIIFLVQAAILPISWVWKGLIDWWLEPIAARQSEKKLREKVRKDLAFLFEECGAKFVANDRKYKHGKVVTLETHKLRFQASCDRGEYSLRIAPSHAPLDWEGIGEALMVIDAKPPVTDQPDDLIAPPWSGLAGLAEVLEPRFPLLEKAFGADQYPQAVQFLERVEGIARQRFVERWNKGVRFNRGHPEANPWNKKESIQTLGLKDYPDR